MTDKIVMDFHILQRKKYNLLKEVLELSLEIGQSMDRNDQSCLRKNLAMRQDPIAKLSEIKNQTLFELDRLSADDAEHIRLVMSGKKAESKVEQALLQQIQESDLLLDKIMVLDEKINKRVVGKDSVYSKK